MYASRSAIADGGMRLNSCRRHRDTIVAGTLCVSVVARMKMMCSGGSSDLRQRVERRLRQHVYLVDEIHLVRRRAAIGM